MKKDIVIIGASGFGREVAWLIEELDEWNIKGFIDDSDTLLGSSVNNYPVLGKTKDLLVCREEIYVVIAIGNPEIRKNIYQSLSQNHVLSFPNIIAKDVRIDKTIKLGIGNIICTHNVLTTNITLGNFNHINLSCTLGHDTVIHDFVTIYPGVNVSGNVTVHSYSELGTGSKIIQGKTINENIIVGAGGVVVRNLTQPGTYVGVPVKQIS